MSAPTRPYPVVVHVLGWASQQYGSFERHTVVLADRLRRAGGALHLVYRRPPVSAAYVGDVGAPIHVLPGARHAADLRYVRRCAALLHDVGATHLHAHHGTDAYLAIAAAHHAGVDRRYVTRHTTPGRSRLTAARLRHRVAARSVDKVFAVSEHVAAELVALGVPSERVRVRMLGVDTGRYRPDPRLREAVRRELGIPEDVRVVLTTSHLRAGKGVERMPDVAAALARDPGRCLTVVAGVGPRTAVVAAHAAAHGLGPDAFRMVGVRDDVAGLLAAADVFVLPTDATEGLPAGVVEALATATPAVVTDVAGLGALVGHVARVVPPGRTDAIVAALRQILASPAAATRLGTSARAFVAERFGVGRCVDQLMSEYGAVDAARSATA